MDAEIPGDLIEINDPQLNVTEIMAQLRARVQQRREELGYDRRAFPTYGSTMFPGEPDDLPYDANLYHHLRSANDSLELPAMEPLLAPSPFSRLPLIGVLWQRLRPAFHNMVLFYVNRALASQLRVNRHLVSVLNQLTTLSQDQQGSIRDLEGRIKALEQERTQ